MLVNNVSILLIKMKTINIYNICFTKFSGYDSHLFFKELIDIQDNSVHIKVFPQLSEKYLSVNYGGIKFLDGIRFLTGKLKDLPKSLSDDDFVYLGQEFRQYWQLFTRNLAYPYELFKSLEYYEKPVEHLQELWNEAYYSNLKNDYQFQ